MGSFESTDNPANFTLLIWFSSFINYLADIEIRRKAAKVMLHNYQTVIPLHLSSLLVLTILISNNTYLWHIIMSSSD